MTTRKSCLTVRACLLFLVLIKYAELYTTRQQYCTLPNGSTARCKLVPECQTVVEYLNRTKLSRNEYKSKLNEFSCKNDRWKETTHVCCPEEPLPETDEVPPPPDVTNHANLHLLPKNCGEIDLVDKIRNGKNAKFNEFPWMALLSYNTSTGPNFMCGATIINERYILTAAHCVVSSKYPLLGVRVGEYNLATKIDCEEEDCLPPVQDLAIEKIIYPEDYNVTIYANDIALIRVTKINITDNAQPICLPIGDELRNVEFAKGIVTGWGFIDPDDNVPTILQRVTLERRDISVCKKYYLIEPSVKLSYKQYCVGGLEKKDSCGGDSGGPLHNPSYFDDTDRYVQYGIVSFGPAYCGYEGAPGVYTKIPYYMDWILDNLEP